MPTPITDVRDVSSLCKLVEEGAQPQYLFFWGHQPDPTGAIDQACLSQWWPAAFTVDGVEYATAEHWMMAEKARLFGDEAARQKILRAKHPRQAKKLGRGVRGFEEEVWQAHRFGIVVRGNGAKFQQNPELARFLLNTHPRVLVEASPVDGIWGIGLAADHPQVSDPRQWRGLNLLGFALMEVRARLEESSA